MAGLAPAGGVGHERYCCEIANVSAPSGCAANIQYTRERNQGHKTMGKRLAGRAASRGEFVACASYAVRGLANAALPVLCSDTC